MKPDGARIRRCRSCAPLALFEHGGLVVLLDFSITSITAIPRRLWLSLLPAQALELKPLPVITMRAGHKEALLIGRKKLPLDPGKSLDRRR